MKKYNKAMKSRYIVEIVEETLCGHIYWRFNGSTDLLTLPNYCSIGYVIEEFPQLWHPIGEIKCAVVLEKSSSGGLLVL